MTLIRPLILLASTLLIPGCATSPSQAAPTPASAAATGSAGTKSDYGGAPSPAAKAPGYVFAWPFLDSLAAKGMQPRGGSTRGQAVTPSLKPSEAWKRLRAPGLTPQERDRAAILAMAGDYRASFDFLETVVFPPPAAAEPGKVSAAPARPYRSWGTERVYVVADSAGFVSLQHLMVMFFADDKGQVQGPMVMKHWRQDWRYQPDFVSEFQGHDVWKRRDLDSAERRGAWSQTVFHVDDSPRYGGVGRWTHNASFSAWEGSARRPLPRREHTVRSDYHALEGVNRHVILPTGWVHEQDNLKLVLDGAGRPDSAAPYRAREAGVDRYDRIEGFDFSAGDAYWRKTSGFWTGIRKHWDKVIADEKPVRIADSCQGEPAFAGFFRLADSLGTAGVGPKPMDTATRSLLECLVAPAFPSKPASRP